MGKREIPKKEIIICDRCLAESERYSGCFANGGGHGQFERWGKTWQGDIGGTTIKFDFCQKCASEFDKFMKPKKESK